MYTWVLWEDIPDRVEHNWETALFETSSVVTVWRKSYINVKDGGNWVAHVYSNTSGSSSTCHRAEY